MSTSRQKIIQAFLGERRLKGWFSWRPEELILQIGHAPYWGLSFLLFLSHTEPVLFVPEVEPVETLPKDVKVVVFPWGSLACDQPFSVLAAKLDVELKKHRISRADVGVLRATGRSSLPVQSAEHPPLPEEIVHGLICGMRAEAALSTAFLRLFLQKTETEINCIRRANKIAAVGLEAWRFSLIPGVTEAETAAAAEAAIHKCTGVDGIIAARAWAMVQSGPNTAHAGAFNRSSGRRLEAGDLVLIELATCVNGYWSDLTRTVAVGDCPDEPRHLLQAVDNAQRAALRCIRPGISAKQVDAAARTVLSQAGYGSFFTHATGHHVGFRYHDPGFAIAPGVDESLHSGMVITVEPGAYIPMRHLGARIEDNVVVTDAGAEVLS